MRVVVSQKHLILNKRLAKESNKLSRSFDGKAYSKIDDFDGMLLKRDISVEKKKGILIKKLHDSVIKAFSIDKKKFGKKALESFKKRLHNIRKIVIKLRSINYYLETAFLEELEASKIKIGSEGPKSNQQSNLAKDELEILEYTAYKLIGEVVVLDKRLLGEYMRKEERMLGKEKTEAKDIRLILGKESGLLEHLEAKLPPPKAVSMSLIKEPTFTHWAARVFAILSYFEHMYHKEKSIFSKLKKNKAVKAKIGRKIAHLIKEKSKLLEIMEEKAISMEKFRFDSGLKKELHNFTTTISL